MADYGAEACKIERPGIGDPARGMSCFKGDDPPPERGGLFLHLNTNKKSATVNLKSAAGLGIFKEPARWADIVVENFHPRVMPAPGLGYETLCQCNPLIVMTSISVSCD